MPDFELLMGRAGGTRYLAFRPPLNDDQFRRVSSAVGRGVEENSYVTSQVADTTEICWEDGVMSLGLDELEDKSRKAIETLARLGSKAKLLNSDVVFLDGPEDTFTQFEKQQYVAR